MKKNPYFILFIIFFAGVAAPVNQFKVPPMMRQLMAGLDISLASSGWLMSVFALVGLVCAIPAGVFLKRFGNKVSCLAALGMLLAGASLGLVSHSVPVMLISRVMEGAGMCIISVSAPSAIAAWFPPEKRGIPTGIWVTWVPVGTLIMYILAPFLGADSWRNVWWFAIGFTALAFVLFLVFFRMPDNNTETAGKNHMPTERMPKGAMRNICLVAAVFMLFNITTISIKSYLPAFLEIFKGYTPVSASGVINIMVVVSIFAGPLTGIMSDKTGRFRVFIVTGCVAACVSAPVLFLTAGFPLLAALFVLGIACGNIATVAFASPSVLAGNPSGAAMGLSIVAFGQYLGMSVGPVLFSTVAGGRGWYTAGLMLVPVMFTAGVCAFLVRMR